MRHLDVTLSSVLTTRYCIPEDWQTVLHQICSTKNPFDLRCGSCDEFIGGQEAIFYADTEVIYTLEVLQEVLGDRRLALTCGTYRNFKIYKLLNFMVWLEQQ